MHQNLLCLCRVLCSSEESLHTDPGPQDFAEREKSSFVSPEPSSPGTGKHNLEDSKLQQQILRQQIAGYKELRIKLEDASAKFEQERLTFDFQKVIFAVLCTGVLPSLSLTQLLQQQSLFTSYCL